jgi:hypothetical protein
MALAISNALTFATREAQAALSDDRPVAVFRATDEVMR